MECNKEEATRAKELAEKKMEVGDFVGAQKLVMKAQRLFPDLENISQLIAICDVHCSAQKRINGLENWYGILQVEQFADEAMIKKQYRKLALLLHPDKNKFAGAESAFKMIGEANRLLADQTKRSQYDVKYRAFSRAFAPRPRSNQSNMNSSGQFAAANSVANSARNQKRADLAFWTCCQFCGFRYKYLREYVNTLMHCHSCQKSYIAVDTGPDGVPPGTVPGQFSTRKEVPSQGPFSAPLQNNTGKSTGAWPADKSMSSGQTQRPESAAAEVSKNVMREEKLNEKDSGGRKNDAEVPKRRNDVGGQKNDAEVPKPDVLKPQSDATAPETCAAKPAPDATVPEPDMPKTDEKATSKSKDKKKKRKAAEESSESFEIDGCDDCGKEEVVQEKVGAELDSNENNKRRSSRKKRLVSYAEDGSDDDFVRPPTKKSKSHRASDSDGETKEAASAGGSASASASADGYKEEAEKKANWVFQDTLSSKDKQGEGCKANGEEAVPSSNVDEVDNVREANENPGWMNCPDAEFNDFDKAKGPFAVNQVWAIYDPTDGMPRFYARVRKVVTPDFKLKMVWLEAQLVTKGKENETVEYIPIACGKFENGETEDTTNRLMFSHQMYHIRDGRSVIVIYPRKGETWALFRDWDVGWSTDPEKHKPPYKYDFVEILTDFSNDQGIGVAYLGKVKGFVSLFDRAEQHGVIAFSIPPGELHRFSHRVPSCKMTGKEREGVPAGSFELDPAALPNDIFELDRTDDADTDRQSQNGKSDGCCRPKPPEVEVKTTAGPERVHTSKKRQKTDKDDESSMPGKSSWEVSNGICSNQDVVHATQSSGPEVEVVTSKPQNSSFCQVDEMKTQKKFKGSHLVDALKLRRSPRVLSEKNSQTNSSQQKAEDAGKRKNSEDDELSGDGDGRSDDKLNTPRKLEKNLATEALRLRRSTRVTNKTDSQQHGSQDNAENIGGRSNSKKYESKDEHLSQSKGDVSLTHSNGPDGDKMKTPKKLEKDLITEALSLRRSPRGANRTDGQLRGSQDTAESIGGRSNLKKYKSNDENLSQPGADVCLTQSNGPNGVTKSSNSETHVSSSGRTGQENTFFFKEKNSEDKFRVDQIWAIYSTADGMPKEYVQIKKIEATPKFKLHVALLELWPLPKNATRPICCGLFKVKTQKSKLLPRNSFSHQLNAVKVDKNKYEVYPRKGEIWALYKKGTSGSSSSYADEHDIVEVLEDNGQTIKVVMLMVNGSRSIHRARRSQGSTVGVIGIPRTEVARFSHQIPAFRQQTRRDRVGGFWELDPAAIPGLTIVLD